MSTPAAHACDLAAPETLAAAKRLKERIPLKVAQLAAVSFGYTRAADQRYNLTFCAAVLASPVLGVPFGSISKKWAFS